MARLPKKNATLHVLHIEGLLIFIAFNIKNPAHPHVLGALNNLRNREIIDHGLIKALLWSTNDDKDSWTPSVHQTYRQVQNWHVAKSQFVLILILIKYLNPQQVSHGSTCRYYCVLNKKEVRLPISNAPSIKNKLMVI